ncbi:MAG TPA: hypothetical protein VF657_06725 [Actinoplanes sp.]|jgi:hypothetical protein
MRTRTPCPALLKIVLVVVSSALTVGAVMQAPAFAITADRPLTATQDGTVTGLSPGSAAQEINYTITNPNSALRHVAAVTISLTDLSYVAAAGAGVGNTWLDHPAGGSAPGCTTADFAVVQPEALHRDVPSGRTSFTGTTTEKAGTITMLETNLNQDDCRGATGRLALTVVT